ncbi:hypothetical protein SAY86_013165 [Trapa natans]|uniref:Uncharacterized protein n=1 Tax=Trapa natans TaxID=22666 RepID=A0AAN7MF76_TRANT|nr:hypothetical protein SAY86_013165 [Trapa natans]
MKGSAVEDKVRTQETAASKASHEEEANDAMNIEMGERLVPAECSPEELADVAPPNYPNGGSSSPHGLDMDIDVSDKVRSIKRHFVEHTDKYAIPQLERLYTRVIKGVFETRKGDQIHDLKQRILCFLSKFAEDVANF